MQTARFDTLSFTLPSCIEEVTLGQARAIAALPLADYRQILLILSGLTGPDFRGLNLPLSRANISELITTHLPFIFSIPTLHERPLPKFLTLNGKSIPVPTDLGVSATVAEWWDVEDELAEIGNATDTETVSLFAIAPLLLSVFLCQKITHTPYSDIEQARALLPVIDALPAAQALPVAAFFLSKLSTGLPSGKISLQQPPEKKTRISNWPTSWLAAWNRFTTTSPFAS